MRWHIGDVQIPNRVVLAPMAGVTDLPFRLLVKEFGCGLVYAAHGQLDGSSVRKPCIEEVS